MKATTSDHMLNIVQNNNLLYKILQPLHDQTAISTGDLDLCRKLNQDSTNGRVPG